MGNLFVFALVIDDIVKVKVPVAQRTLQLWAHSVHMS